MKIHLALAVLAVTFSTAGWSDVTSGQLNDRLAPAAGAGATLSGVQSSGQLTGNWPAALDRKVNDASGVDLTKDLTPEARILNENLANFDKSGQIPDPKRTVAKTAAQPGVAASGAKAPAGMPDDWGSEWANQVRDFIAPIHKGVANSEVVQAVRELDGVLPKRREIDEPPPPSVVMPPIVLGTVVSADQRQREKLANAISMEQFIDEIKPYAYGLVALLIVGYLAVVLWQFLMWKQNKSSGRRRRSRGTRKRHSMAAGGLTPDRGSVDAHASRTGPLASRAAPLQGDTQNDRLST